MRKLKPNGFEILINAKKEYKIGQLKLVVCMELPVSFIASSKERFTKKDLQWEILSIQHIGLMIEGHENILHFIRQQKSFGIDIIAAVESEIVKVKVDDFIRTIPVSVAKALNKEYKNI